MSIAADDDDDAIANDDNEEFNRFMSNKSSIEMYDIITCTNNAMQKVNRIMHAIEKHDDEDDEADDDDPNFFREVFDEWTFDDDGTGTIDEG